MYIKTIRRNSSMAVKIKVKQFVLLEECPDEWKELDLYIIRDENLVFYIGQSCLAFDRVWDHLKSGFKGRSDVGLFILCNWPKSMNYEIELLASNAPEFEVVGNNLLRAEEMLIKKHRPCFNISQNRDPSPIPEQYLSPGLAIKCPRSLTRLRYQAELSIRNDERKKWMEA
jgi:hypothetical protein